MFIDVQLIFYRSEFQFRLVDPCFRIRFCFFPMDRHSTWSCPIDANAALWFSGWSVESFSSQLSHNAIGKRQANVVSWPKDTENGEMDGWMDRMSGWQVLGTMLPFPWEENFCARENDTHSQIASTSRRQMWLRLQRLWANLRESPLLAPYLYCGD